MKKRLKSWARTLSKLALLVLCYFWIGAAYKAVYAQTHDITRLKKKVPLPYYQQEFLVDSIIHQTWILGPDFAQFIGELPNLGALVGGNPFTALADYFTQRERELSTLPDRYPRSLYAEAALADASSFFSSTAALLNIFGERERPRRALASVSENGVWQDTAVPDFSRQTELSLRLANDYPDSPQAPAALKRVAEATERDGQPEEAQALYRRIAMEYPRSEEAEAAAQALYQQAVAAGKWEEARGYKRQALIAMERLARERHPGKAIPAAETVNLLGYHVDLTGINLQLRALPEARTELELAQSGVGRLSGMRSLDEGVKGEVQRVRERMDRATSELWVADFFQKLEVGAPGPPPRPQEHDVTGRVEVEGKPLKGTQVQLLEDESGAGAPGGGRRGGGGGPFAFAAEARFRAIADQQGRYRITGVPAGNYRLRVLYALTPEETGGQPIVPAGLEGKGESAPDPGLVQVADKPVEVPAMRFKRGLRTVTFGEALPDGRALRVQWEPLPGAAAYQAEIRSTAMMAPVFQSRAKKGEGLRPGQPPVPVSLWKSKRVTETRVECPLLDLAPDQPRAARAAQYQYLVTAYDASGKELTRSAWPLGRFHLSPRAVAALLEQNPPTRQAPGMGRGRFGRGRGPFGGLRRPRPPMGGGQP